MEDAKFFLLSSDLGPAPLATTADTALLAFTYLGVGMDQIIGQQNKRSFFAFIVLYIHAISFIKYF
jgi:hypothetical protein